mmetsp:Transcript_57384/g.170767  ORF Transcript_57384/g.170767 Transcript_57384/m.170767 type:complete len:226 (+) Transcript_57384:515-1192(+)
MADGRQLHVVVDRGAAGTRSRNGAGLRGRRSGKGVVLQEELLREGSGKSLLDPFALEEARAHVALKHAGWPPLRELGGETCAWSAAVPRRVRRGRWRREVRRRPPHPLLPVVLSQELGALPLRVPLRPLVGIRHNADVHVQDDVREDHDETVQEEVRRQPADAVDLVKRVVDHVAVHEREERGCRRTGADEDPRPPEEAHSEEDKTYEQRSHGAQEAEDSPGTDA